jgi:hypothetical protein
MSAHCEVNVIDGLRRELDLGAGCAGEQVVGEPVDGFDA